MMASKPSHTSLYAAITGSSSAGSTVSILLMHSTQGIRSSRMRSIRACSGAPTWAMGSTSSSAQSTSERLEVTTLTIYSPRAERGL